MKNLISNFGNHLVEALETVDKASLKPAEKPIHNVLITGLGGSGIGGTIVAELAAPACSVPITVNKGYHIPAFVNENTLVLACSYSGNTEETLSAVGYAMEKGAQVACICSGGELMKIASEKGFNTISMVGGNPPRSMLAYSFVFLLHYLDFYGLAPFDVNTEVEKATQLLRDENDSIHEIAAELTEKLYKKTAILYAVDGSVGIASRIRQQLNENSKMLAWEAAIPEMNHNELVGWEGGNNQFVPVFLRHRDDYERNQKRIEIIEGIMAEKTDQVLTIWSKGETAVSRALYLIHLGDWLSFYLSEKNGVDIMDIRSIDLLKSELSKIPL